MKDSDLIKALERAEWGLWIAIAFGVIGAVCKILSLVLK